MKQKYFSPSLFWDFFKQIKLTGIVLTAVLCIITAVPIFVQYLSIDSAGIVIQISEITPVLYVAIYFIPIIFMAGIFKFLNKRKDSDFFHSLPPTRLCTFLSGCLASFCWSLITIVSMVLIGYLSMLICGLNCSGAYIGYLIAYNAVVALAITGCASIALSATGTLLPGLCLTFIIMFLPRFILVMINITVRQQSIIASALNDGLLFNQNYNFITAPLFSMLASGYSSATSLPAFAGGYIYTAVLGLIYILLGALAFRARKSESAEKSAPNKVLQHIYRLLITLPTLLAASIILITGSGESSLVVILIVLSVIIYYVYEAITTKSFKSMLKATPLFLADIAVCAVVCLASYGITQNVLNNTPEADQISHIEINVSNNSDYYSTPSYTQALQQTVQYKDKDIIALACEKLHETAQTAIVIKNNPTTNEYISGRYITFVLKSGAKVTRVVDFGDKAAQFESLLWNEPQYVENLLKLPEDSQITSINNAWPMRLEQAQLKALWDSFKNEYYSLPDQTKAQIIAQSQSEGASPFAINVMGSVGLTSWNSQYCITSLTPQTFKLAAKYANDEKNLSSFKAQLDKLQKNAVTSGKYDVYLDIGFYNISGLDLPNEEIAEMLQNGYSTVVYAEDSRLMPLIEHLKSCALEEAQPDQAILTLNLITYERENGQDYYTRSDESLIIISVDQNNLETIINLLFPEEADAEAA